MTIKDRIAAALDATHSKTTIGIHTEKMRDLGAAYLDGKKLKVSTMRRVADYLEMIARSKAAA